MNKTENCDLEPAESTSSVTEGGGNIILSGEISMEMWEQFASMYLPLMQAKTPVSVLIYSGGGDPIAACAIYDMIRASGNDVTTCGFGLVASAATIILQAGKRRLMSPYSTFMIHGISLGMQGELKSHEVDLHANEIKRLDDNLYKILSERSNLTAKKVKEMCLKDTYMSAQDAVKMGFADGIIKRMDVE